ncbi:MAG: S16 family serine protease [Acidimicrobiales bacterium]
MNEESTSPEIIPPAQGPAARALSRVRASSFAWKMVTVVIATAAAVMLSAVIPARGLAAIVPGRALIDDDTVAQKPGSANPTATRVSIAADGLDDPDGSILFTTVQLDTSISVFDWLSSEVDDDIDLRRRSDVLGDRTDVDNREINLEMMQVSKDNAVVAALEYLGIPVFDETGLGIDTVRDDGPAQGVLVAGDVIVAVDGVPITGFASLQDVLATAAPGDVGVITVEKFDTLERRVVELAWGEHPDRPGDAYIGVNIVPRQEELPLPFEVEIDSGSIGGPSAGLAFSLTILDLLTDGDLTGGLDVAVTGTIAIDGTVGPVGGSGQKAAAARDAGAAAFIVPLDMVPIAAPHAGDMPVIGVSTLEEALGVLADLGGDPASQELIVR